ncbi:MAG: alpha/beta fold hydrolase, partial [Ilumatobacteraceae bacterium]
MQITNGKLTLHVAEDGDPSAPPILLLHGITSFGGTWDWIVPELAERFRVLRLDFRGHGASDRAPGEYSSSGYISDAVAAC